MKSPLAVVIDDDASVRDDAHRALTGAGIEVIAVATPHEALDVLRVHPHALFVAVPDGAKTIARVDRLASLCRLRADESAHGADLQIEGRSQAAESLRRRVRQLSGTRVPVLFFGEEGSGRAHAARCLHATSEFSGPFAVAPRHDAEALASELAGGRGTRFLPSLERVSWTVQEGLAEVLASGSATARLTASMAIEPGTAAEEGRLLPALVAAFSGGIVPVPALRDRPEDIGPLARTFLDEVRRLNALPPLALADESMAALSRYDWPGNVGQLRGAIESAVILAQDGIVRAKDLPESVRQAAGAPETGRASDRRFRDAKRTVVEAFEHSYLRDLLKRHGGNVTSAAEQSGMLRSALQRLLRKHDLHSADFRTQGPPDRFAS
jgi:DNA-binding NtrC family response regulator